MTNSLLKAPKENGTLILEYLKDSKRMMGISLWNVRSPQLPGYKYGEGQGLPTLSLEGLKERNLIRWF